MNQSLEAALTPIIDRQRWEMCGKRIANQSLRAVRAIERGGGGYGVQETEYWSADDEAGDLWKVGVDEPLDTARLQQLQALDGVSIVSIHVESGGCCPDESWSQLCAVLRVDRAKWPNVHGTREEWDAARSG